MQLLGPEGGSVTIFWAGGSAIAWRLGGATMVLTQGLSFQFILGVSLEKVQEVLGPIPRPSLPPLVRCGCQALNITSQLPSLLVERISLRSRPSLSRIPSLLHDRRLIPRPSLPPLVRCGCQALSIISQLPSRKMTPALLPWVVWYRIASHPQLLQVPWVVSSPTEVEDAVRVVAPVAVSTIVGSPPFEVAPLSLPAAKMPTGHLKRQGRYHGASALGSRKSLTDH